MKKYTALLLPIGFLEFSYDDFQQWLEEELEIEGSEAEVVIAERNTMYKRGEKEI